MHVCTSLSFQGISKQALQEDDVQRIINVSLHALPGPSEKLVACLQRPVMGTVLGGFATNHYMH